MNQLKLEEGKKYLSRCGEVVGPMIYSPKRPFDEGESFYSESHPNLDWHKSGHIWRQKAKDNHPYHLVCEWVDKLKAIEPVFEPTMRLRWKESCLRDESRSTATSMRFTLTRTLQQAYEHKETGDIEWRDVTVEVE